MPQSGSALSAFGSTPQGSSSVMGAAGAVMQAGASIDSGMYRAQVARNNQVIANDNANFAVERANQMDMSSQLRTGQVEGAQRAGFGASGVDVNVGSAVRTQQDTARIGAIDATTIQQNGARSAWGFTNQGRGFAADAGLDEMTGAAGAMRSLVGGASDFASKWSQWQTAGVPGTGS